MRLQKNIPNKYAYDTCIYCREDYSLFILYLLQGIAVRLLMEELTRNLWWCTFVWEAFFSLNYFIDVIPLITYITTNVLVRICSNTSSFFLHHVYSKNKNQSRNTLIQLKVPLPREIMSLVRCYMLVLSVTTSPFPQSYVVWTKAWVGQMECVLLKKT